jgi:hypothetical protein
MLGRQRRIEFRLINVEQVHQTAVGQQPSEVPIQRGSWNQARERMHEHEALAAMHEQQAVDSRDGLIVRAHEAMLPVRRVAERPHIPTRLVGRRF